MAVSYLTGSFAFNKLGGTPSSISISNAVTSNAGDCLLCFVWANTSQGANGTYFSRNGAGISDTSGNTYKFLGYNIGGSAQAILLVAENIKAAASGANTVTFTFDGLNLPPSAVIAILEYTGQVSCTCASSQSISSTTYSAGNLITQASNEVMVSCCWSFTTVASTPGSGTSRGSINIAGAGGIAVADLVAASAGTNASITFTGSPSGAGITIAVSLSTASYPTRSLALTPPMGYDTWRGFGTSCTETNAHQQADKMKALGFIPLGYSLFNVNDVLYNSRSGANLVANASLFPSGDTALWTYVKGDGLTPAAYLGPGTTGCGSFPGSNGNESTDAALINGQGAKYLMYDSCTDFTDGGGTQAKYATMGTALNSSIVYLVSCPVSEFGAGSETWTTQVRGDVLWSAKDLGNMTWANLLVILQTQVYRCPWITKGRWNLPDFLGVGNGTLTDAEGRTNFALWSVLASPLWVGCDLTSASATTLATLQNTDLIGINQDSLGGTPFRANATLIGSDTTEVWMRPLSGTRWAAVLSNQGSSAHPITINWSTFGQGGLMNVYDCWAHANVGLFNTGYTASSVATHDNAALIITPANSVGDLTWYQTTRHGWLADYGTNSYAIFRNPAVTSTPGLAPIFFAVYLNTVSIIGTATTYEGAVGIAQTDLSSRASYAQLIFAPVTVDFGISGPNLYAVINPSNPALFPTQTWLTIFLGGAANGGNVSNTHDLGSAKTNAQIHRAILSS